jgi:hypothetical protein
MKRLVCPLFLLSAFMPILADAATPSLSSVSGAVSQGQLLTIIGASLTDENVSVFHPFFSGSAYGFEGASPAAVGYTTNTDGSGSTAGYMTDVKLSGNNSIKFHAQGYYGPEGYPNQFIAGGNAYWGTPITNHLYVRQYVRYSLNSGVWPGMGPKMTWYEGTGGIPYDLAPEPTGEAIPSRWRLWASNTYNANNPWGQLENNRWYCVEEHYAPGLAQVWIDGMEIINVDPGFGPNARWADFGMVNGWDTKTSSFNLDQWVDNLAFSTSQRIGCTATVEIADSNTYESATKRYQAPVKLDNGDVMVKADLTGLGAGPYYLFVTNNREERSAAYLLGGTDTTPPASPVNLSVQ